MAASQDNLILKKLLYYNSKLSNKPELASSLVSAYSFGTPSLRLPLERIEHMNMLKEIFY